MAHESRNENPNGPLAFGGFATAGSPRRPDVAFYSRGAIGNLKDLFGISSRLLEVNARTGILAGQLKRAGMQVAVHESGPEFQAHLTRTLPGVAILDDSDLQALAPDQLFDGVIWGLRREDQLLSKPALLTELQRIAPVGHVVRPNGAWVVVQQDLDELMINYDAN